ncbi:MAG: methyltransferase [Acidobacteriota bacterium]
MRRWSSRAPAWLRARSREAIAPGGTLLVVEAVLGKDNDPHPAKWIDLHMMVALGGRERSTHEWDALLRHAGFEMGRVVPMPGLLSVIEASPA